MVHECPICGQICDCDLDDTGGLPVPDDCPNICPEDDYEYGCEEADDVFFMEEE